MIELVLGAILGSAAVIACQFAYHKGYIDALEWAAGQTGHTQEEAEDAVDPLVRLLWDKADTNPTLGSLNHRDYKDMEA